MPFNLSNHSWPIKTKHRGIHPCQVALVACQEHRRCKCLHSGKTSDCSDRSGRCQVEDGYANNASHCQPITPMSRLDHSPLPDSTLHTMHPTVPTCAQCVNRGLPHRAGSRAAQDVLLLVAPDSMRSAGRGRPHPAPRVRTDTFKLMYTCPKKTSTATYTRILRPKTSVQQSRTAWPRRLGPTPSGCIAAASDSCNGNAMADADQATTQHNLPRRKALPTHYRHHSACHGTHGPATNHMETEQEVDPASQHSGLPPPSCPTDLYIL